MIKYNSEATIKQSELLTTPQPKMTKEQFKKAVITNLPRANNPDVADFMEHLGISRPANTPAEGLEKKMRYWKDKDTSVQERIIYAQSWNLAVALLAPSYRLEYGEADTNRESKEKHIKFNLETLQKYFYLKLKEDYQTNGN